MAPGTASRPTQAIWITSAGLVASLALAAMSAKYTPYSASFLVPLGLCIWLRVAPGALRVIVAAFSVVALCVGVAVGPDALDMQRSPDPEGPYTGGSNGPYRGD